MNLYKLIVTVFYLLLAFSVDAQIITTVAGNGLSGSIGDGGAATAARINGACGGAFDKHGNYYVADILGNRLRKVDPMGIISTVAGTSSGAGYNGDNILATAAQLNQPNAVWVDSIDNIYINDGNNFRVRKINTVTGIITTIAGTGIAGNYGNGVPATNAQLGGVQDICMDRTGNLYVADQVNQSVRRIDNTGIITTIAGGSFSASGTGDGGPATDASFNFMFGLATDDTGNIYIADYNAAKVRKINSIGIISTIAGNGMYPYVTDGTPATATQINPYKLTFNRLGNLTITDIYSDRVYLIDNIGLLHCIAGNGVSGYSGDSVLATSTALNNPAGVAYDTCGNLYISESTGKRVRKLWFAGMATPPVALVTPFPNDTICSGTAVTLTAMVSGADSVVSYKWYVNGTIATGATSSIYIYTPANGDTINCRTQTLVDCNGAFTIGSNTIHITTITTGTPTISLNGVSNAAPGTTVTITATVSGAGGTYLIRWMNHGSVFATTAVPLVTYVKGTEVDTITARMVPTGSCYDSVTTTGHVVTVDHTGINKVNTALLNIFPNPAHSVLQINSVTLQATYTVLDITGRQVMSGILYPGDNELHIERFTNGVYMLQVQYATGERSVYRLVKE